MRRSQKSPLWVTGTRMAWLNPSRGSCPSLVSVATRSWPRSCSTSSLRDYRCSNARAKSSLSVLFRALPPAKSAASSSAKLAWTCNAKPQPGFVPGSFLPSRAHWHAAQRFVHFLDQRRAGKRLLQKIVVRQLLVLGVVLQIPRHINDAQIPVTRTQFFRQFRAAHFGHHHISQQHINRFRVALRQLRCLFSVLGGQHLVTGRAQKL